MSKEQKHAKALVDTLLGKVQSGDIELVRERRLRGPSAWSHGHDSYYIALYPKNQAARQWLLLNDAAIALSGRVDPIGDFHGKYYLRNGAEEELNARELTIPDDGFGTGRPHALPVFPKEVRAVTSPLKQDGTLGNHDHALLLAAPFSPDMLAKLLAALAKEGLLPDRHVPPLEYAFHVNHDNGTMVLAVPVPQALVVSYAANPHGTIPIWGVGEPIHAADYTLAELVRTASSHLQPVPREKPVEDEKPKAEEPKKEAAPPPPLRSKRNELRAIGLRVQHQPQWNGGRMTRLIVPKGKSVESFTDEKRTVASTYRRYQDPLTIGAKQQEPDGTTSYVISQNELARLQEITGTLKALPELSFDESVLKKLFEKRSYNGLKPLNPQTVDYTTKNRPQGIPISHTMFARILPSSEGDKIRYVVYFAADHKQRLDDVVNRLQIGGRSTVLNRESERPCLIRLEFEKDAWELLRKAADEAAAAHKTTLHVLDESRSLQYIDDVAREEAGVHVVRLKEESKAPEAPKKEKLTGEEAVAEIARKLAERNKAALGEQADFKIKPDDIMKITLHRVDAKGHGSDTTSVVIRGKVNALNHIRKHAAHATRDFASEATIRLIEGHKNDGTAMGVLEVVADGNVIAAIEAARGTVLTSYGSPLHQDGYKKQLAEWFASREKSQAEHDALSKAWEVMTRADLHPVRISAPDRMRIERVQDEIGKLQRLRVDINDPVETLEAMKGLYGDVLKRLRDHANDEPVEDELLDALKSMKSAQVKAQKGILERIDNRIKSLLHECHLLEQKGGHVELVALHPSKELQRALEVITGSIVREVKPVDNAALRIVPVSHAELLRQLRNRGKHIDSNAAPVVRIDALDSWVRDTRDALEYEREKARQQEHEAHAGNEQRPNAGVLALKPETIVHDITAQDSKAVAPKRVRRSHAINEVMGRASRETFGFMAWEAPYHEDKNMPLQHELQPQPVLVLSTSTHKQLEAVLALYDTFKEEGWLLEKPAFYGEIRHTSKLTKAQQTQVMPAVNTHLERLEAMHASISNIRSALSDAVYFMRQNGNDAEEIQRVQQALADYKTAMGNVVHADDTKWIQPLEAALKMPDIGACDAVSRLMGQRLTALNGDIYDASADEKKTRPKKENQYVISIHQDEEPMLYPVDTKEGRVRTGRKPMQMDTWRRVVLDAKGTAAVKLYLNPERLEAIGAMLEGKPSLGNLMLNTQSKPFDPDDVESRIHSLQMRNDEFKQHAR